MRAIISNRRLVIAGGILIEFPLEEIFTMTSLRVAFEYFE